MSLVKYKTYGIIFYKSDTDEPPTCYRASFFARAHWFKCLSRC